MARGVPGSGPYAGTARRGKRVQLNPEPVRAEHGRIVAYVCGAKPLPFGEITLVEGVEVPGAADWRRLEAWVSQRRVRPVYDGDDFVPYEEFATPLLEAVEARKEAEALAAAEAEQARIDAEQAALNAELGYEQEPTGTEE